jgi:hypothetical protein
MGAIDGIARQPSFAKLARGGLSDRSRRRKPWILAATGLALVETPVPAARSALAVMGARFADRIGKGIRGSAARRHDRRRDAAGIRGGRSGLRQSLDTWAR